MWYKKEHIKTLNFQQNQTVEQPSGKVLSGGTYSHRNKEHDMFYFFL